MSAHKDSFGKLIPAPREINKTGDKKFLIKKDPAIYANFEEVNKLDFLLKLCGFKNKPVLNQENTACNDILLLHVGEDENNDLVPKFSGQEAYAIEITDKAITIASRSIKGAAYALKTLAKLSNGAHELPALVIQDVPDIKFRGVHLCIFYPEDGTEKEDTGPEDIEKMILLAAMSGYNHVALEFWGMFPYQRRPYACWPNTLYPKKVLKRIVNYALDDLHIIPIPCQNMTSHAGWSRIISRKHVVLDQRPDLADMWIPGGWCFATENADTKAYLRDLMEELLETYKNPPFFHACCDKAFGFGSTEKDRTKSADLLFGNHLCFLNSFLQEHGARMVMWADMLYTSMDALYWKASPNLIDMLPRNILMNIWTHNDPGQHWWDVNFFQNKGFQTIYSPFIDRNGVRSMINVCKDKGSFGILQTTWHKPQTARDSVVFSGAFQWQGREMKDIDTKGFIKKWYDKIQRRTAR